MKAIDESDVEGFSLLVAWRTKRRVGKRLSHISMFRSGEWAVEGVEGVEEGEFGLVQQGVKRRVTGKV